jgi:hypothetical protein
MKKNTMITLANYFAAQPELPADVADAVEELHLELAKNEAKAQANREAYAAAHDIVMDAMDDTPKTVAEIYDACADELPEGFSKSKIQYALLNYWNDEVVKVENPKGANTYRKA